MYKISCFTFIFSLIFSLNLLAIDETKLNEMPSEYLLNFLSTYGEKSHFIGIENKLINYYVLKTQNPKGVIIISPGRSEAALKYSEFIFDIKDLGYTIYIIDHRGQGESERLIEDKIKSHVVHFSDYVEDFNEFVNTIVRPEDYDNSFIIAHSMGGAIASGFLENYPKKVTGVILSSPMFEIHTGVGYFERPVANLLNTVLAATEYAPGQGPYDTNMVFEENKVTSSVIRFDMKKKLYATKKTLQTGGSTVNWLKESLDFTARLRKIKNLFQVPTLLLQAGQDKLVELAGQNQACEKLSPKFCKIINFKDSEHEIFMESDITRNQALTILNSFILQNQN